MPLAHTVPRAYLVGFQDKNKGGLVVVDRRRPAEEQLRAQRTVPIKSVSTCLDAYVLRRSTGTYDGPERALNLIEQSIPKLRANLRKGPLSDEDLGNCARLAATQYARGRNRTLMVRPFRIQLDKVRKDAVAQGLDGDGAVADFVRKNIYDGDIVVDPENLALLAVLQQIILTLNPLNAMYKCIITSERNDFITSDEPVVWFDPTAIKRRDRRALRRIAWSQSCEVTYPLGRRHCILMAYNPILPDAKADDAVVEAINARTASFCANEAYVRPCDARGQDALLGAFRGTAAMLEPLSTRFAHPHGNPIDTSALRKRHGITD
jgi:hypothetical protein